METKKIKTKKRTLKNKTAKKIPRGFVAPKINRVFDEAVPVSLLYGPKKINSQKPVINFSNKNHLSPFVVSFAHSEAAAKESNPAWRLNFALAENELEVKSPVNNELSLSREDLLEQLLENEKTMIVKKQPSSPIKFSRPFFSAFREAWQNFKRQPEIFEPTIEPIDLFSLNSKILENISAQEVLPFDLPEAEVGESDESEILTWDDVVNSIEISIPNTAPKEITIGASIIDKKGSRHLIIGAWKKFKIKERSKNFFQQTAGYYSRTRLFFADKTKAFSGLPLFKTLPVGWYRALAAFVLVSFAFVLPLRAMETIRDLQGVRNGLEQNGLTAVAKLNQAVSLMAADSALAASSFEAAKNDFSQAQISLDDLGGSTSLLLSVLPNTRETYQSGRRLIAAGESLATAGKKISYGLTAIQANALDNTGKLEILAQTFEAALPALKEANDYLQEIDPVVLLIDYQDQFSELQKTLPGVIVSAEELTKFSQTLAELLGAKEKKRYLLLFQNNIELRPTGGFLGSFALLDVSHGEVANLEIPEGGSYDLQGSLKNNYISPLPLQLLSARWEFQDANWFPDFPTSARQVLSFYQEAGGPTVDGVVAVNASFINALFNWLGPIEMADYDKTIDAENFLFETQKMVEYDYVNYQKSDSPRKEAAPKAFIGDLASIMLNKIKDLDVTSFLKILDYGRQGLNQKDLQLYFTDEDLEKTVLALNWGGEMKRADKDYLMVVDSNLGGGKTDGVIKEKIDLKVEVRTDGRLMNTLTITREHQGLPGAMFTGVNNVDYLRVYVPKGSRLLSANGFSIPDSSLFELPGGDWKNHSEITAIEGTATVDQNSGTVISEEGGKTSFGNWVQTKPGESSVAAFVYELPFSLAPKKKNFLQTVKNKIGFNQAETYSLLIQKQSGALDRTTTVSLVAPENWQTVWSSQEAEVGFDNSSDQIFSAVLETF